MRISDWSSDVCSSDLLQHSLSGSVAMRAAIAGLLLAAVAGPVCADDLAYRWNLADLYPDAAAWNADAVKLQAQLKDLSGCTGQLADSRARFKSCLDLEADATKRHYRPRIYSSQLQIGRAHV